MKLYYCMGGGYGHQARTLAILSGLHSSCREEILILSSKTCITEKISRIGFQVLIPPLHCAKSYGVFLQELFQSKEIDGLILDAFPAGLVGEFNELFLGLPRLLLARRLRMKTYLQKVGRIYKIPQVCIELEPGAYSGPQPQKFVRLSRPICIPRTDQQPEYEYEGEMNLVVHSGSQVEQKSLLETLPSDQRSAIFPNHQFFEPWRLKRGVRVITAAGYNSCALKINHAGEWHLKPLQRRFDNQHFRAQQLESNKWLKRGDSSKDAAEILQEWLNL